MQKENSDRKDAEREREREGRKKEKIDQKEGGVDKQNDKQTDREEEWKNKEKGKEDKSEKSEGMERSTLIEGESETGIRKEETLQAKWQLQRERKKKNI